MTIVKGSTKRGQSLLASARYNEGTELSDVYDNYSANKGRAIRECRDWCNEANGDNFRIISHNSNVFSVAWEQMYEYTNPKTGEVTQEYVTRIETARHTYIVLRDM